MNPRAHPVLALTLAASLTGCVVAPCPQGSQCTAVGQTGGSGGTGGAGGATASGGSAGAVIDGGALDGASDANGWTNVTSNLARTPSECGNLSYLSAKQDEDLLIAGVAAKGLWSSTDGGGTWHALGGGNGAAITNQPTSIVYDQAHTRQFWESGLHNGGGAYMTNDDGATQTLLGNVRQIDQISVDFTDPDRKTLLAGGDAQARTLYRSVDQGTTWKNVGGGFPQANDACARPLIIDTLTFVVGCSSSSGGAAGVLRSEDAGDTWTRVATVGGTAAALLASDGAIYWASEGGGLATSADAGKTWTELPGANAVAAKAPLELPDGRLAALGLASVLLSADHGTTWRAVVPALPYADAAGLTYSPIRKAFYVWHFDCTDSVPSNAIMSYPFDYLKD